MKKTTPIPGGAVSAGSAAAAGRLPRVDGAQARRAPGAQAPAHAGVCV